MRTSVRRVALGAVPLLLVVGTAGCSGEDGPEARAEDAATRFADAVSSRDITAVPFTEMSGQDAQDHMAQVFESMEAYDLDTAVQEIAATQDPKTEEWHATATIGYTWAIAPDQPWTYSTDIALDLAGEDDAARWEVVWEPGMLVPDLAPGERLVTERVGPERAGILGQGGEPIVANRAVNHLGIDKTHAEASLWDAQARALAGVVGIDPDAYAQKVAAAGEKAYVEAITLRAEETPVQEIAALDMAGISVIPDEVPLAPTRDFARPILGRAGEATAEIVEDSDGQVVAGDTVGLSGLQKQYDAQLRGVPGTAVYKILPEDLGGDGKHTELFRVAAVDGTPLQTTLDVGLQNRAEALLADQAVPAAIVAIRPSTGEVLAAASGAASEGLSTATTGQYAPGSTFKVVTALAAMRTGTTPESTVACTPDLTVGGYTFQNVPGYPASALGEVPFRTAFANSCNTAMISLSGAVSQQALHDAAADLGIGVASDLGAPAAWGDVPTEAGEVEHAASTIGQGKVQASPLAMATLAATVQNGSRVAPVLVRPEPASAEAPDGSAPEVDADASPDEASAGTAPPDEATPSALTPEEAATLQGLMRSVVTDGSASALADLGEVGAKTGTAQYGDGSQSHAWMIAFQGDLAVAVFVETGDRGSTTAGPIMREFLAG